MFRIRRAILSGEARLLMGCINLSNNKYATNNRSILSKIIEKL